MSHRLRWWLGGVPSEEMTINRHARQAIDERADVKHNMIEIRTFDQRGPFASLGQKFNDPLRLTFRRDDTYTLLNGIWQREPKATWP